MEDDDSCHSTRTQTGTESEDPLTEGTSSSPYPAPTSTAPRKAPTSAWLRRPGSTRVRLTFRPRQPHLPLLAVTKLSFMDSVSFAVHGTLGKSGETSYQASVDVERDLAPVPEAEWARRMRSRCRRWLRSSPCCFFWNALCCPPLPAAIIDSAVYVPPTGVSYLFFDPSGTVLRRKDVGKMARRDPTQVYSVKPGDPSKPAPPRWSELRGFLAPLGRRDAIAGLYLPCQGAAYLVLMTHTNGDDLASCIPLIFLLRERLGVAVVTYDYADYGLSTGRCNEDNFYAAATSVLHHITAVLRLAETRQVVLLGVSLGTVAAVWLGSLEENLAGIILIGAFTSALHVLYAAENGVATKGYPCESCDKYQSFRRAARILAPLLVIHGLDDLTTHPSMGLWLLAAARQPVQPLFLPDTGHGDILRKPGVWARLTSFFVRDLGQPVGIGAEMGGILGAAIPEAHRECLQGLDRACPSCRRRVLAFALRLLGSRRCAELRSLVGVMFGESFHVGLSFEHPHGFTLAFYRALVDKEEIESHAAAGWPSTLTDFQPLLIPIAKLHRA